MNPLIHTLATTIAKEATMTSTTANDRREGYADGLSHKWQPGRSAAYDAANWEGGCDDNRLSAPKAVARVTIWQRVVLWLRACLSSAA